MRLLRWFWHGDAALAQPHHERLREAGAAAALLSLLALWTGFCGLALLFLEGSVTSTLAAGLTDHAGQRLLGAQWLGLAAVYALAAWRGSGERRLRWLAVLVQLVSGLATGFTLLSGHGSAGTAFVCIVSIGFALLLLAFQLAGQPAYYPSDEAPRPRVVHHEAAPVERVVHHEAADPHDARTERLDRQAPASSAASRDTEPPAPAPRPRSADDDLLGL